MDKITVLLKQRVTDNHKGFGIKMFKLCNSTGYTFDMKVYLGKERQHVAHDVTTAHITVKDLTRRVEGCGHKLYMENFFSFQLF